MRRKRFLALLLALGMTVTSVYPSQVVYATQDSGSNEDAGESESKEEKGEDDGKDEEEEENIDVDENKEEESSSVKDDDEGESSEEKEEESSEEGTTEVTSEEETTEEGSSEEETTEETTEEETTEEVLTEDVQLSLALEDDEVELLAYFDFEGIDKEGDTITATEGDAKAKGSYALADSITGGKALELRADKKEFLSVTDDDGDSILKGVNEVTISYTAKQNTNGTNWIAFAAANDNAPSFRDEHYIGFFQNGGKLTIERYDCDGSERDTKANATADVASDDWVYVDAVIANGSTTIYVNGKQRAQTTFDEEKYLLKDIVGDDGIFYIGKATWGSGEYTSALIDDFRIYKGALSEEQIKEDYDKYKQSISTTDADQEFSLNAGFVSEDMKLFSTYEDKDGKYEVTWESSDEDIIRIETEADQITGKVTRGNEREEVTLTASYEKDDKTVTKDFKLVVIEQGDDLATFVSSDPIEGQAGGMLIAAGKDGEYDILHKSQPILYTSAVEHSGKFVSPELFRKEDGESFGMVASDGGKNTIFLYDSEDLTTYENERTVQLKGIASIDTLHMVYDITEETYKLFAQNAYGQSFLFTSKDLKTFEEGKAVIYEMEETEGVEDAVWTSSLGLTEKEIERVVNKFTNPYATDVDKSKLTTSVTVETGNDLREALEALDDEVTIKYSNGEKHTYGVHFNETQLQQLEAAKAGTYTLEGVIGGDSYYVDAENPLIAERADPYVTYDKETGYYYFTASYPQYGASDTTEGYSKLVLRRAKTISELASAEEYTIWKNTDTDGFNRFIWAPEIHKIGDDWYFIATASNSAGNVWSIRPFMMKFEGKDMEEDFINPEKWGTPEYVKPVAGDKTVLNGFSLDMTYFEDGDKSYLAWPDETINSVNPNGLSDIFIAEIDKENPTQLTSRATLLTAPEFNWEKVRYNVNEGPTVIHNDGKIYLAFSAAGTGSEYCVGYLVADEGADLLDADNWTKNPYPILTSGDFNDTLSGPGHNSFSVNAKGEPVIIFHARPADEHNSGAGSHSGDPLYDPCRSAFVRPVFFDEDGIPILNMSDTDFAGEDGSTYEIQVTIKSDNATEGPVLVYDFNEDFEEGVVKNSAVVKEKDANDQVVESIDDSLNATLHGGAYVQDAKYGQVLYLDGDQSYGGDNSYLEFPEGFFDGRDTVTISMDINQVTRNGNYFTFGVGQDDTNYLFMKAAPTSLKAAITASGSAGEKIADKSSVYPNTSRVWQNVKLVVTKNSITTYRDGKLVASRTNTGISMSKLGENLKAYLGKSFYENDLYMRAYFDNVKVYDYAMTEDEVAESYQQEQEEREEMLSDVERVAELLEIPNEDDIRGNITLLSEKDGVSIEWKSSDEDVISTKVIKNKNYDDTPAGVVTRQDKDTKVTLTATLTKDGEKKTKKFHVTVKAAPEKIKDEDYTGYLFVHFTGATTAVESSDSEQTYFSTSKDGLNWTDLNDNKPVLKSTLGESGVRDHFIARSAEGDKFYMIATDLSIYHDNSWGEAGSNGSHGIVVWESEDLVNWSEPRLCELMGDSAGCTWAPEFIYDDITGEYVVYWASTTLDVDENEKITQEYENHTIYYAKTRDFVNFTEPQVYHAGGKSNGKIVKVIDSTMIKSDDTYYRFTKNESTGNIVIDKADTVLGEFTNVASTTLSKDVPSKLKAVEGPIIFKMNEKDNDGNDQFCLMVDQFATGKGYYPLVTSDLASGEFKILSTSDYSMPSKYRHGYVMPVTEKEYAALQVKWGDKNYLNTKILEKSESGNPMLGFDENGDIIYGGDPSILVDGDTVYAYVGHDTSETESYYMPNWLCYSSKNMTDWEYEGVILENGDVSWAADDHQAWAGQVMKYKDKYYFYYCTETKGTYGGGKSIGVAVSDSPTGPFTDIGKPLVRNIDTTTAVSTWEDIDPTAWIETDEKGVEHRYLGWGNSAFFNCELNEDMISIMDKDGDPSKLSCAKASVNPDADIKVGVIKGLGKHTFTEAPYYYRQQNKNGKYYGYYYMFFACDWREQMAYAYAKTREEFENNEWTFGGVIQEPSATGNTNHMAVFDFKGQTYFVYHDGSLPHGSGFRRVACCEKFSINEDGSIDYIRKTATGLTGTLSRITDMNGDYVAANSFENTLNDSDYPMLNKSLTVDFYQDGYEAGWEINPGKFYKKQAEYVSIESDYKPGLYLSAGVYGTDYDGATIPAVLAQDAKGSVEEAKRMMFRTLNGFAGSGVTFESAMYPGYYLASRNGELIVTKTATKEEVTFFVSSDDNVSVEKTSVMKTKRFYTEGDTLTTGDIRVMVYLDNGEKEIIRAVKTNADKLDMSVAGDKELEVTFEYHGKEYTRTINIHVVSAKFKK